MGENSKIQWTDHTFNGVRGCSKVSDGCLNCYAETMSHRNPKLLGVWGEEGTRVMASESMWREPLRWERDAKASGVRARVFSYSLGDVFESPRKAENMKVVEAARTRLFTSVIPSTPNLDWMLLTKRPENIRDMVPGSWLNAWPENAWIGTSVEDQRAAGDRIPRLLEVPASVRFLSMEPLLEAVDLAGLLAGIALVIVGGESGPGARVCDLAWFRKIVAQCREQRVKAFVKQGGSLWFDKETSRGVRGACVVPAAAPWTWIDPRDNGKGGDLDKLPVDLRIREMPEARR
jgi:protein gp37